LTALPLIKLAKRYRELERKLRFKGGQIRLRYARLQACMVVRPMNLEPLIELRYQFAAQRKRMLIPSISFKQPIRHPGAGRDPVALWSVIARIVKHQLQCENRNLKPLDPGLRRDDEWEGFLEAPFGRGSELRRG
jgi:hypothetical protein